MRPLDAALELARLGAYMVPILAHEKRPPFKTGKGHADRATRDPSQLYEWFNDTRTWQLGVVLHLSGWVAVDIDPRPDNQAMAHAAILEGHGRFQLSDTAWETTPSGGLHYIYQTPAGVDSTQLAKTLAPGVELQHNLLVVAPSRGRVWMKHPRDGLLELPAPLLHLARKPVLEPTPRPATSPNGVPTNMHALIARLRRAGQGERNSILFWAACRAGESIEQGKATLHDAGALIDAAIEIGLDPSEAEATWRNGITRTSNALKVGHNDGPTKPSGTQSGTQRVSQSPPVGLSSREQAMYDHLLEHAGHPTSTRDLATALGWSRGSASRAMQGLKAKGVIQYGHHGRSKSVLLVGHNAEEVGHNDSSTEPIGTQSGTQQRVTIPIAVLRERVRVRAHAREASSTEQSWQDVDLEDGWGTPAPGDIIITRDKVTQHGGLQPFT